MNSKHVKHTAIGFASGLLLLASYFSIVGLLQGLGYALSRFLELWYLMVPLSAGFGFQMAFYSCFRDLFRMGSGSAAASGGISTASMIACCAHHLTDVIPLLGISALGIFLLEYQPSFLMMGVVSNIIGIVFMLKIAKTRKARFKMKLFKKIMKTDLDKLFGLVAIIGIIFVALSFVMATANKPESTASSKVDLDALSKSQNQITFAVDPLGFGPSDYVKLQISIDTHTVDLDFDLPKISMLVYDGKEYVPVSWSGPAAGHHMSGVLEFPPLGNLQKSLKLVVKNAANADWVFEWQP